MQTVHHTIKVHVLAEKAFDHLDWPFRLATLRHIGFKGAFLQVIHHLYNNSMYQVKTPFALSSSFSITKMVPGRVVRFPPYYAHCVWNL